MILKYHAGVTSIEKCQLSGTYIQVGRNDSSLGVFANPEGKRAVMGNECRPVWGRPANFTVLWIKAEKHLLRMAGRWSATRHRGRVTTENSYWPLG